jgi:hypothetical protein
MSILLFRKVIWFVNVIYYFQQEPGALNLEPAAPVEEERHSLMDSKFQRYFTFFVFLFQLLL